MAEGDAIDWKEIQRLLPHRYPFLLVDRVLEITPGRDIRALKNVSINEEFFQGHFPQLPVMPGVLILEALAQASGILASRTANTGPYAGTILLFAGIDKARFRRPVGPGDTLILESVLGKQRRDIWKFSTRATVDGEVVCDAEMMCAIKHLED